jgi:dual specificity protein phosphatase 1B
MNSFDEILPGLYLGSYDAACDAAVLESCKITHILTVASDLPPRFPGFFTYKIISALDTESQDLYSTFQEAQTFISQALESGRILVHCLMGVSRSATIVIAYLMLFQQVPLNSAFNFVYSKRPQIGPNDNFLRQLKRLESSIVSHI